MNVISAEEEVEKRIRVTYYCICLFVSMARFSCSLTIDEEKKLMKTNEWLS